MIPLSKFSLGQPVECMWDYAGQTLGIVFAKYWQKAPSGPYHGYWSYSIKTNSGKIFDEQEDCVRGVRLKKVVLNVVGGIAA